VAEKGRVSISADVHEIYKQLTNSSDKNIESAPFKTMKDVFMMATCLGFQSRRRSQLTGKKEQPFHYSVFSESLDVPILKSIAIAETNRVDILADFEQIIEIAEEYANEGIHELIMLTQQPDAFLWNLVERIRDES
jgi:dnd system-associated protein 4